MTPAVLEIKTRITQLFPYDALEAAHRTETLAWLNSTDDVFRRAKPAQPDRHLVSYVVPTDPATGDILLVDHINAGLWLPPGGHVEPGEDPALTARREIAEELGITDPDLDATPQFLTVTTTVGLTAGHTDVSLWYALRLPRETPLIPDAAEFHRVRWWTRAELDAAGRERFDPHLHRYLAKRATK